MSGKVLIEVEDHIGIVTIFRPEKHNAFDQSIRVGLADALEALASARDVRAIVITGHGKHFSVGGDIAAFVEPAGEELDAILDAAHRCIRAVRYADKPVIAAVEGAAAGGAAGLILACDAIVVARDAKIAFPFLKIGLVPDWGCVPLLRAKVGEGAAKKLLLSAAAISAEQAIDIGVADELAESGATLSKARQLAQTWASFPGMAWQRTKAMINAEAATLDEALVLESEHQAACFHSKAFKTALQKFLIKE
ncbi:enoyl-CoA hydratase [Pollutimonas subterranea]|uniref:Enoyl-CoA hydratase n=1 Tax=Pollutimonas subterranea TaxID=2045210 RepID=A0A2N4U4C8_9BURK|nr:enoyl-CoA hydratase/isomerase family protein [Pollutimonas subterranea]PLC49866.1 enoyl-CoA hydratase [Pollutimonas subterranea]